MIIVHGILAYLKIKQYHVSLATCFYYQIANMMHLSQSLNNFESMKSKFLPIPNKK